MAASAAARRLREALRRALALLYRALPKLDIAVLWGWPDYEDNVLALESALQRTRLRRVVLLMSDRRTPPPVPLGARTWRVTKDSPAGWAVFLVARYVLFTHRCFMHEFPPNVVAVNVWHGMPIKRTGVLSEERLGIRSTYVLATSPFWGEIMERSMGPGPRALTTGLPRNDRLFQDAAPVRQALGLDARDDVQRLVAWLPTYRRSVRGFMTVDGRPTDSPFELDDLDPAELNRFLAAHRAFAVVKPHPMASFDGEQRWSNLLVVDSAGLLARSLTLYQLLGASDVLVSDISSVTVDFLLLDRPILHAMADLDQYRATRGFSVDRIDDLLMGPVATTADEVQAQLALMLEGEDPDVERRRRVRALSHEHPDGGATCRLLEALGLRQRAPR